MIDKKQLIGGAALVVVALGISVATGKIDISKLTGSKGPEPTFERKLPPPVKDAEVSPEIAATPNTDVIGDIAGESKPANDDYVGELTGDAPASASATAAPATTAPATAATVVSDAPVAAPAGGKDVAAAPIALADPVQPPPRPAAQLAATDPSKMINVGGKVFTATPVVPAGVVPSAPGASLPAADNDLVMADSGQVSNAGALAFSGGEVGQAAMASLPNNATGEDLLKLQTQLAVLEKQKAIASGQESIAESHLKVAKAAYEMTQIGQLSPEDKAKIAVAEAQAKAAAQATAAPTPPPSPIFGVRLLSTARANGDIGATVQFNGKLVDVKKGSVVSGYSVEKITENSVVFIVDGKPQTIWID